MCGGILYILQEMKVKNVIIGRQFEENKNLEEFIKISKEKNIKLKVVEAGQKINIEKNIYLNILWPSSNLKINENSINNNALVLKLNYENKFSMIFTGDIEEEAEEALVQKYKNSDVLKSEILKVAHHGSKSSSTEEFLKLVKPKIALIGVGKNNLYGHPSNQTIERLKKLGTKIFRTDLDKEIVIRDGEFWQ